MSEIKYADANGLRFAYEQFGKSAGAPLLLINGLGSQMMGWPDELCEKFAARGYWVTRYDNRDVGLSTHLHDAPHPDIAQAMVGDFSSASYRLSDMADDAAGLLDALGIERAHIVGASMGGMIAQEFAINYPQRALSLTSIYSTTGDRSVGQGTPEAMAAIRTPPPPDREGAIAHQINTRQIIGSPAYPIEESVLRSRLELAYDRAYDPVGTGRQRLAILSSADRTPKLRTLDLPTVVIHGEDDPLVNVSGGRATAEAIPGAKLIVVPGMGHDLPVEVWDTIVDGIASVAR